MRKSGRAKSLLAILAAAILLSGCVRKDNVRNESSLKGENVEAILSSLSLRQKIGQMFVYHVNADFQSRENPHWQKVVELVRDDHIGGLHLWRGDPYATAYLTNHLQSVAKVPLLFTADLEHGVRRFGGTDFPPNMALAAGGDDQAAYHMGLITGSEGRALGIHLNFAPVVDVNNNPANPIINVRSFGEDPQVVSRFATAFIRGCRDAGMLTTAKHFPGHGNTAEDSHIELASVQSDSATLENVELAPFRAAIGAGVDAIMTAHINVHGVPMNPYAPATISPEIMTTLLRKGLGFNGLLVTDAMTMWAMSRNFTDIYATVQAIKAGVDVILVQENIPQMIAELEKRVRSGEIAMRRIDASVRRILEAKQRAGLFSNPFVNLDSLSSRLMTSSAGRLSADMAQKAMSVFTNQNDLLPLRPDTSRIVVVQLFDEAQTMETTPFSDELRRFFPNAGIFSVTPATHDDEFSEVLRAAQAGGVLILPTYTAVRAWKGHLGVPDELHGHLAKLFAIGAPVIAVSFGNPYVYPQFASAQAYLAAFGSTENLERAAARAIAGAAPIAGRSPISLPGYFSRGEGLQIASRSTRMTASEQQTNRRLRYGFPEECGLSSVVLDSVSLMLRQAVADSVFPGAVLLIARRGIIAFHENFGNLGYGNFARAVPLDAIYDLASVTKVIAATSACMLLFERGMLDLDAPVQKYLPDFAGAKKELVTVRHLLTHCAGLVPFRLYFKEKNNAAEILATILNEPLEYPTGSKTSYSDLDFILLGKIVEKLSGLRLDAFCTEHIFRPLRMSDTFYLPDSSVLSRVAPTEFDAWRGRLVHGQVHDENAHALGGVSGHAGLFASARDVATFLQMLLNGGEYGGVRLLNPETIAEFIRRQNLVDGSSRALGWDTADGQNSAGHLMSQRAFGHTGYTGTSVWVDPEKEMLVILLSNRVHPTRANTKILKFRAIVHDAIMRALM